MCPRRQERRDDCRHRARAAGGASGARRAVARRAARRPEERRRGFVERAALASCQARRSSADEAYGCRGSRGEPWVILYADASALVKRYVAEHGSADVIALTSDAEAVATAIISRAEVSAALARSVRLGIIDANGGRRAQRRFAQEWPDLVKL